MVGLNDGGGGDFLTCYVDFTDGWVCRRRGPFLYVWLDFCCQGSTFDWGSAAKGIF